MKKEKDISILAIETSCDETGAAVVRNGREVYVMCLTDKGRRNSAITQKVPMKALVTMLFLIFLHTATRLSHKF